MSEVSNDITINIKKENYPGKLSSESLIWSFPIINKKRAKPNKYGVYSIQSWTIYVGLTKFTDGKKLTNSLNKLDVLDKKEEFNDEDLNDIFANCGKIKDIHYNNQPIDKYHAFYVVDTHMKKHQHKFNMANVITKGKNLGRKNATNSFTQAMSMANSLYKKQLGDSSFYAPARATGDAILTNKTNHVINNLLEEDVISKGVYIQEKLDGVRCCIQYNPVNKSIMSYSRSCKEIIMSKTQEKELSDLFNELNITGTVVLDGEIYKEGMQLKDINGIVRKTVINDSNMSEKERLDYYIFDIFFLENKKPNNLKTSQRILFLNDIEEIITSKKFNSLKVLKTYKINTNKEIIKIYHEVLQKGGEGLMIKLDRPYTNETKKNMIKVKPAFRDEFKLIGFKEGDKKDKGKIIYECEITEDSIQNAIKFKLILNPNFVPNMKKIAENGTFSVRPKASDEWREAEYKKLSERDEFGQTYFSKNYLNTPYTVEFQDYFDLLIPQRPIGIGYRDSINGQVEY